MSRTFSTLTLGLLVALTGCPSGDDTSTSVADGSSSGTPATSGSTTEMSSADSSDGPATSSMTGASTGTTTDEPGTTMGVDECGMCVESMCADELADCEADPDCSCFQDCAEMNPGVAGALQCGMDCGVDPLDVMTVTGALAACSQMSCPVCLG